MIEEGSAIDIEVIWILFEEMGLLADFKLAFNKEVYHICTVPLQVNAAILALLYQLHADYYLS